jgi:hypothetical protein
MPRVIRLVDVFKEPPLYPLSLYRDKKKRSLLLDFSREIRDKIYNIIILEAFDLVTDENLQTGYGYDSWPKTSPKFSCLLRDYQLCLASKQVDYEFLETFIPRLFTNRRLDWKLERLVSILPKLAPRLLPKRFQRFVTACKIDIQEPMAVASDHKRKAWLEKAFAKLANALKECPNSTRVQIWLGIELNRDYNPEDEVKGVEDAFAIAWTSLQGLPKLEKIMMLCSGSLVWYNWSGLYRFYQHKHLEVDWERGTKMSELTRIHEHEDWTGREEVRAKG